MDIEKIFHNLESNQTQECEEAKKKLVEIFSQIKEQWLVQNVIEYYLKTGSSRIMEVLVKVQSPHDNYIFDRLTDMLKTPALRVQSLNMFCFVVRKHPTWLFKVEKHRLIKDIFKLLMTEKEIVPLMSALFGIITLLPIIPSLVPNFLNDLFDVFGHLASWNCQNPNRFTDDKLVHLQIGLQMLFHCLYGMFPCNFLSYLSDFIKRDKASVFQHTIKPLLSTVRMHPLLITATVESEVSNSRWKEMEPHDVVVECAKLSLSVTHQDFNVDQGYHSEILDAAKGSTRLTPSFSQKRSIAASGQQYSQQLKEHSHRRAPLKRFDCGNSGSSTIWSPYNQITAAGPIPLTPTPSYILPISSANSAAQNLNSQLLGGVSGSSPPEAAVEATPETTPMKDLRESKKQEGTHIVANPNAVRAIFLSSQPSSPMRKEYNQFNFPDVTKMNIANMEGIATSTTFVEQEVNTRIVTRVTKYDRRLQQMLHDRTHSQSPFRTIEAQIGNQGFLSPVDTYYNRETSDVDSDLSSLQINSNSTSITPASTTPVPLIMPTSPMDHSSTICMDCNETDHTMCTSGGLHIPTSRSMQLLARGFKRRNRITTYCCNDSSFDNINNKNNTDMSMQLEDSAVKVRRTKSCSSICLASIAHSKVFHRDGKESEATGRQKEHHRLQKSGKMLAIAMATKKPVGVQKSLLPTVVNATTQTIDVEPQNYESMLFEMLTQNNEKRKIYESGLLYPQEILHQFIYRTTRSKENFDSGFRIDQEQYNLLCLQLQYEKYRREIYAERNRRLMGRSRDKRSLEMERDRLREQLKSFLTENKELLFQIEKTIKSANEKERKYTDQLAVLKTKYLNEIEQNKCLRQANEDLQTRLNTELAHRKEINYELEALRGQIFNLTSELQCAQVKVEIGNQCKQELARLESEFIIMGEVQIKVRDRLAEIESYKARDGELQMLQESYNAEVKDLKHFLEERTSYLDSAKHKILDLQAQIVNNEKVITEQKRLLKAVKDEYEEKFKALNKKYDVQKTIIMKMEERIMMSFHKSQAAFAPSTCSPDTDKTDIASSMDRNSPLSTSLASSESLSASLRSTELRNLQTLVETAIPEANSTINIPTGNSGISVLAPVANIIEGKRLPTLDLASSAETATSTTTTITGATSTSILTASAINIEVPVVASTSKSATTSSVVGERTSSHVLSPTHTHPHLHLQHHQKR